MAEARRYPRSARINELLREVVAEALERDSDLDDDLGVITVTAVEADPDLRHARVFYSALGADVSAALVKHRVRIQNAIASQARLKRTPQLSFLPDPSLEAGWKIESIVRSWDENDTGARNDGDEVVESADEQ